MFALVTSWESFRHPTSHTFEKLISLLLEGWAKILKSKFTQLHQVFDLGKKMKIAANIILHRKSEVPIQNLNFLKVQGTLLCSM